MLVSCAQSPGFNAQHGVAVKGHGGAWCSCERVMVVHGENPQLWEVEAGRPEVQG